MKKIIISTITIISIFCVIALAGQKCKKFPVKSIQKIFNSMGKATYLKEKKGERIFKNDLAKMKKIIKPGSVHNLGKDCSFMFNGPAGPLWQYIVSCIDDVNAKSDDGSTSDAMFLVAGKCNTVLCSNGEPKDENKGEIKKAKFKIVGFSFERKKFYKNEHYVEIEFLK